MSGSLRYAWEYLSAELWTQLADFSFNDVSAPPDLFSDLYVTADEFLSPRPTATEMEDARNDPEKARLLLLALKETDFTSESNIVLFLEEAHQVVADYELAGLEDLYSRLLRSLFQKFNLRYRLDSPFIIGYMLPGTFSNMYAEIQRIASVNAHLAGLLEISKKHSTVMRGRRTLQT